MNGSTPSARTFLATSTASTVNLLHTNLRAALVGACKASQTHKPHQLLPFQSTAVSPPLSGVVAAAYSPGSVLRLAIDATRTLKRLASRLFQQGHAGSLNLCRPQVTSGQCFSFLSALIQDANQSERSCFHRLVIPPVRLLSLLAAHVVNSSSGAKKCPTKEFPKPENKFPRIA